MPPKAAGEDRQRMDRPPNEHMRNHMQQTAASGDMPPGAEFVLRTTLTSPYGRKVRMAADILGLMERIAVVPADTLDEADTLRQQNPLGKMPCLLLPDGSAIYDSPIIVELLQEVAGKDRLMPWYGDERFLRLTEARLADGITDAALLMVYEHRFRAEPQVSERWLAHQRGKIERGLSVFEKTPPQGTTVIALGLACALGYLDWRKPYDWRSHFPGLVRWLDAFADAEPAFRRSGPPSAHASEVSHAATS
jgi:glutathione S-transferase